ncbi:MAG: hypothetical protein RR216_02275 [Pseudoflavonifractor sp.]
MSDEEKKSPQPDAPNPPTNYASPLKRVWAWVGVAYMVVVVLLFTYMLAFGSYLQGIGSLMLCPAVAGIAVSMLVLRRTGKLQTEILTQRMIFVLVELLCGAVLVLNLYSGIPALLRNFGA